MIGKRFGTGLLMLAGWLLAPAAAGEPRRIPVHFGEARVSAEVAADRAERQRGLSGRDRLAPDHGMLFVWPREGRRSFWMKDTRIPLSIAFLDRRGHILNIADMAPLREDRFYRSRGAAQFALEVNRGWFRAHGIQAGDRARFRIPARLLEQAEPLRVGPAQEAGPESLSGSG